MCDKNDTAEKNIIIQKRVADSFGGRLLSPSENETTVRVVIPNRNIEFIAYLVLNSILKSFKKIEMDLLNNRKLP